MLDPSFALSAEGMGWLESDPEAPSLVVIAQTFDEGLRGDRELPFRSLVAARDRRDLDELAERVARLAALRIQTFSHKEAELEDPARGVLDQLLETGEPEAELWADEWAFLFSHSWMASTLRRSQDRFREAGAVVVEYGRRLRDEMITAVVPRSHQPEVLRRGFIAKVGVKWLVVGGAGAGAFFVWPAAAGAPLTLPVVRAFDS
jgi:hypothetical protein